MLDIVIKRLISTIPVMLIVATLVFLLLRLAPGDPARVIAGDMASEDTIAQIRTEMGLDQSVGTQYVRWLGALAQGDLGHSVLSKQPVATLIAARLGPTFSLAGGAILLTVLLAVPLGVLAAWRHRRLADRGIMAGAVLAFSVPAFVVGYLLILIFSVKLNWLPVQGYTPVAEGLGDYLAHLVLPVITLATIFVALITRITRASLLDVLGEDFVRTARAKGVTERFVLFRHALRNAAIPIVTVVGVALTTLISGVVVTETVFNISGVGRLIVDAVLSRDYPVVQGTILFFSFLYVFINLLIDIAYVVLDPRIRY
ncbi:ABC transporter permease [Cupriavidus plantarum]|uniref:Peptide/nickel transport system permease protein n=1 Tax=Cupriavidus plantarum TaxID=942865 RepID=A0A316EVD6_9BURK|nr:ABC transporter permease [Cupriavidus plantarum]NYI00463.1 peptide/nickel transport system permease protein [Cupriavidus plantarum]PWK34873.1 peptide/nickel transport system permease protein [Cupriavidus plantarum]REE93314.1 peptide/nickel transport system permease protein [Cupriavidus plantarum]RLK38746.1 peptide/nickel transport system permease protein [Cupriavidus plantarum]CAG2137485.1 Glutathione transport system permease protein GsiC [Cupriavidus plantarum]